MNSNLRLLFIGDLHHQSVDRGYLMCSQALPLWRALTQRSHTQPDHYFQLGDLIDGYELPIETNKNDLLSAVAELRKSSAPAHAIIGNHETYWLPEPAFHLQALALPSISRVIENGWRVILFDTTVHLESYGELTPERAHWLASAVNEQPHKSAIIVQHQLIHASDEICTHRHYVRNSGEYRRLLAQLPQIRLIVTGHRHIPTLTMINAAVPQVTLGAFCSFPFTVGELCIDSTSQNATFREVALENLCAIDPAVDFAELKERSQRLIIKDNPDVWRGRARMTPELCEIKIKRHH